MSESTIDEKFWRGKKVFVTGHTGFKGAWLSFWLTMMGAKVSGYSLSPTTEPNLFKVLKIDDLIFKSTIGDICDASKLKNAITEASPDLVFHLAAQALVIDSYIQPAITFNTNVMGTVNFLEAIRNVGGVKAIVVITTDKCYRNQEWEWGYREVDQLGGDDPYSSSKSCAELVVNAYEKSFFNPKNFNEHGAAIATARAGNVVGGGDWSENRLIPDLIRSISSKEKFILRNPNSVRPWQHVLDPLAGYLLLAQKLFEEGAIYNGPWNFAPIDLDPSSTKDLVAEMVSLWGGEIDVQYGDAGTLQFHEAKSLRLDCSKSRNRLGWKANWTISEALKQIVDWSKAHESGKDMAEFTSNQINQFSKQTE